MLHRVAFVACLIAAVSGCGGSKDTSSEIAGPALSANAPSGIATPAAGPTANTAEARNSPASDATTTVAAVAPVTSADAISRTRADGLAERAVDQLAAQLSIELVAEDKANGISLFDDTIRSVARLEEPLDLRLARALDLVYIKVFKEPATGYAESWFADSIRQKLDLERCLTDNFLKEHPEYIERRVRAWAGTLADDADAATQDEMEITYNRAIDPQRAANIVRLESIVKSATSKELVDVRNRVKERFRQAISKTPKFLELLPKRQVVSESLRTSREQATALIDDARKVHP